MALAPVIVTEIWLLLTVKLLVETVVVAFTIVDMLAHGVRSTTACTAAPKNEAAEALKPLTMICKVPSLIPAKMILAFLTLLSRLATPSRFVPFTLRDDVVDTMFPVISPYHL